jgi:SAM-dependent methyltransferase
MTFNLNELAGIYGYRLEDIASATGLDPASINLNYERASRNQIEGFIEKTRILIETNLSTRSSTENQRVFEAGWGENLALCRKNGVSTASLRPLYARRWEMIRYNNTLVLPENPHVFEDLLHVSVALSFRHYLSAINPVYEFGCGTARFLYLLGSFFPEKELYGLDWSESSVDLIKLIAQSGRKIQGHRFDMLNPELDYSIKKDAGVFTIGALEQLGNRFGPFLGYLLAQKPAIVVHHEPIIEFYDANLPLDQIAIDYHRKRGYLDGYLTELRRLEADGKLRILKAQRTYYGDGYHESASLVVWQPA